MTATHTAPTHRRTDSPARGSEATRDARELASSTPFRVAVRVGFAARALTYALIGAIVLALALGAGSSAAPDQQGALQLVASAPLGGVALALAAAGLAAYALWKLALAWLGTGPDGGGGDGAFDRVSNLAGGVVYIGFCVLAVKVLLGQAGNQGHQQRKAAAGVLGWPAGRELVGAAGIVLVAICLQQAYTALRGKFVQESKTGEMSPEERRAFVVLGRVGLSARSLVFGLSGYFLVRTAIDFKVSRGVGIDGTLAALHSQAYGNILLALVGAGLLVFAAFSALEARRRRL